MEQHDPELPTSQFHSYQRPTAVPHRERSSQGWRAMLEELRRAVVSDAQPPAVDWGRSPQTPRRTGRMWSVAVLTLAILVLLGALKGRGRGKAEAISE